MKAVRIHETGGPAVLQVEDVEQPVPPAGHVLIRVAAAGVNYTDVMARQGIYLSREAALELPAILGTEVAGVVVAVGDGVPESATGRRVVGFVRSGYAEYAVAPHALVAEVPEGVDLVDATTCLVQGVTAWHLLQQCGRLEPGQTVLIHAAAGGVGSVAVQLARILGAGRVVATAGTADKRKLAEELGADLVVDYTRPEWPDEIATGTGGRGVDIVLDAVGGEVAERSLGCLAPFGRLVVYGVSSKQIAPFAGSQLMLHNHTVVGYWLTGWLTDRSAPETTRIVDRLLDLHREGRLRAVIRHAYSLADAAQAHRQIAARGTTGKVVLTT